MNIVLLVVVMLVVIILLMFFSARFAGLETALTNLSVAEIATMIQKKEPSASYVFDLKKDMNRTLIAILIGNNIVNILLASLAALFAEWLFSTLGVTIVIIVITFLTIVFCDIVPKSRGIVDDKNICIRNAKRLYFLKKILTPLISFFVFISKKFIKYREDVMLVGDDSIKNLASLSVQQGKIKVIEKDIIDHVFLFWDKKVYESMIPLKKTFFISKNYSLSEARAIVLKRGFSRVPYFNENNEVVGVLYSKDLLKNTHRYVKWFLRKPFFVFSMDDISDVFSMMKKKKIHMAIVLDEEKKCLGIVTLEDILEELVWEIYDEFYKNKFIITKK